VKPPKGGFTFIKFSIPCYTIKDYFLTGDAMDRYNPDNFDPETDPEYWLGIASPNADDAEDYDLELDKSEIVQ
jgi:hypothetical protein